MLVANNLAAPSQSDPSWVASPNPIYCVVGDTLCELRVWSEDEWEQLEVVEKPTHVVHVPGLGWVGAVQRPIAG